MTPITSRIQIPKIQTMLLAHLNLRRRPRNLPRHKRPAPPRALMVKQNPITRIHPIRLPIIHRNPERIELRSAIRTARVKRRLLRLRRLDDFAVQLRRRGLVEPDVLVEPAGADGVEETERAESVDIARVFGHLEGDFDVRLGAEIVDLRGLDGGDDVHEVGAIGEVAVV